MGDKSTDKLRHEIKEATDIENYLTRNKEETQKLLKFSGNRDLYARDERDTLILFALQRNMTVMDVNELLIGHAFPMLDTAKE